MPKISTDEQPIYLKALELAENDPARAISYDFTSAKEQISSGFVPEGFELFQSYLQTARAEISASHIVRGSGRLSALSAQSFLASSPVSSINLKSEKVQKILKEGIQTEKDISLALQIIETVAPEFAPAIQAYRASEINITLDEGLSSEGTATFHSTSYYDRNAEYPRHIVLKSKTEILTLVHELMVHASVREVQPEFLKAKPYPHVVKEGKTFREIRSQAMDTLLHEEAEAFVSEMFFVDRLSELGITFQFQSPQSETMLKIYRESGGAKERAVEVFKEYLKKTTYQDQAKAVSVIVAVAGKLNQENNPRFSPKNILELISEVKPGESGFRDEGGKVDPIKAAQVIYNLVQETIPSDGRSTFEILSDFLKSGKKANDPYEGLVQLFEARFDDIKAIKIGKDLEKELENAPTLGPRKTPVNLTEDRNKLKDPVNSVSIVETWGSMMRFLERLKQEKKIEGRAYLQVLLDMAERAPDPLVGKLYGQALKLAYAQADDVNKTVLLLDLANSLVKSGYVDEAAEALNSFSRLHIKEFGHFLNIDGPIEREEPKLYLKAVSQLPSDLQTKVLNQFLEFYSPFRYFSRDTTVEVYLQGRFDIVLEDYPEAGKVLVTELNEQPFPPSLKAVASLLEKFEAATKGEISFRKAYKADESKLSPYEKGALDLLTVINKDCGNTLYFHSELVKLAALLDPRDRVNQKIQEKLQKNEVTYGKAIEIYKGKAYIPDEQVVIGYLKHDRFFEKAISLIEEHLGVIPSLVSKFNPSQFQQLPPAHQLKFLQTILNTEFKAYKDDYGTIHFIDSYLIKLAFSSKDSKVRAFGRDIIRLAFLNDKIGVNEFEALKLFSENSEFEKKDILLLEELFSKKRNLELSPEQTTELLKIYLTLPLRCFLLHPNTSVPGIISSAAFAEQELSGLHQSDLVQAKESYLHFKRLIQWQTLSGKELHEAGEKFLLDLQGDTRSLYSVAGLTNFAEATASLQLPIDLRIKLLREISKRISNNYGREGFKEKTIEAAQKEWGMKQEVKKFIDLLDTSPIDANLKDQMLSELIENVSMAVVAQGVAISGETLAILEALQTIEERVIAGGYSQTEKTLYEKQAKIAQLAEMGANRIRPEDATRIIQYFSKGFLIRHPWVIDRSHKPFLLQLNHESVGWREMLDQIYPEARESVDSVHDATGKLNVESARLGRVDSKAFEDELFVRMDRSVLSQEEVSEAVFALVEGLVRKSSSPVKGSKETIFEILPSLRVIWEKIAEKNSYSAAMMNGLLKGMAGNTVSDRGLFFGEIFQDESIPLESKQLLFSLLRKGGVLSSLTENFLNREVLSKQTKWTESDYYRVIGKILTLNEGELPNRETVALLLRDPSRENQYFQAMEKWKKSKEGGQFKVDFSNFYDVYFMRYFRTFYFAYHTTQAALKQSGRTIFQYTGPWDGLMTNGKAKSQNAEITVEFSDPSNDIVGVTKHKSGILEAVVLKYLFTSLEAFAKLESEVLPRFIEEFPKELRMLFAAVIAQIPEKKQPLIERLKNTEEKVKTESLSPEKLRGKLLYELFKTLGWAKIGQLLSVSPMLPEEVRKELKEFQDEVAPSAIEQIEMALKRESLDQIIDLKSVKVIKSGSIGEVIQATLIQEATLENGKVLKVGDQIAIKLVTDERRSYAEREIFLPLEEAIKFLKVAGYEILEGIHLESTYKQIEETMRHEMDLKNEQSFMARYDKFPEGMSRPHLIGRVGDKKLSSSSSVLLMEWIDGKRLDPDQIQDLKQREIIAKKLKEFLLKPFLEALQSKEGNIEYQGDPHPGNALIKPSGEIVILDFGQGETISVKEFDLILRLMVVSKLSGEARVKEVLEALMATDLRPAAEKRVNKSQLEESIRKIFNESLTQQTTQDPTQSSKFFDLMKAAQNAGVQIAKPFNAVLKAIHTLEGGILAFDPHFDLSQTLQSPLQDYAVKRFGKKWVWMNFGKETLKKSVKDFGHKALEETGNGMLGALPYGIGEIGSTLLMSLFAPGYRLPKAEEMLESFAIMSAGGGFGKIFIDGSINKAEGKAFFEKTLPPKVGEGITGKGLLRRFVPLAAAMVLDDFVRGRPVDLKNTVEGMVHIGIASGATHLMGAGISRFKWTQ